MTIWQFLFCYFASAAGAAALAYAWTRKEARASD